MHHIYIYIYKICKHLFLEEQDTKTKNHRKKKQLLFLNLLEKREKKTEKKKKKKEKKKLLQIQNIYDPSLGPLTLF